MAFTDEKPTADDLLAAAQQLDEAELERLYAGLGRLRQPKIGRVLTAEETALLQRINTVPPEVPVSRYLELSQRQRKRELSADEREELLRLIDEVEAYQAERAGWLFELARLRGVKLDQLVRDLQIEPPIDG